MPGERFEIDRRNFLYMAGGMAASVGLTGGLDGVKVLLRGPKETRGPIIREDLFRADGRSAVSMAAGPDLKAALRKCVSLIGGLGRLALKGKTVLVKPNVVASRGSPTTTSPGVVGAVAGLLYEEGASRVYVGDMSALFRLSTRSNMEKTGIRRAAEEAGAEALFFEDHEWIRVRLDRGRYVKWVDVTEWVFRVDRVINLPVIKTHRSAGYSICLKNFVGATNFRQRPYFVDRRHWEEVVAELNLAYSPDLNIVDGTKTMVKGGPWKGVVKDTGFVMASGDRVAADAVGLAVISSFGLWGKAAPGGSIWNQRQLRRAAELGLGASGAGEISLLHATLGAGARFEELVKRTRENLA